MAKPVFNNGELRRFLRAYSFPRLTNVGVICLQSPGFFACGTFARGESVPAGAKKESSEEPVLNAVNSSGTNWHRTVLQVLLVCGDGQFIDPVVLRVSAVASHACVLNLVPCDLFIKPFPQLAVLDWNILSFFFSLPAVFFPLWHPLGHTFANVNAIGEQFDDTGTLQCGQSLDDGHQFHLIVGRMFQAAGLFDFFTRW